MTIINQIKSLGVLNEGQFVSLNRDAETGSLDLETVFTKFPSELHNIIGNGLPQLKSKLF